MIAAICIEVARIPHQPRIFEADVADNYRIRGLSDIELGREDPA